ncbi:Tyrosine-protein phosphatase non-receptor type 3 [Myotis davidii]|uniref:Tyrosine-protein phosphatase non-receptor type 3 n=1 Tax=Myotis davidii TaxID=225400 RepID=L5LEZ0_MYODS|nr:Tyrosine-protein phosphatase non-receptor type 3 [Myotis davidii]
MQKCWLSKFKSLLLSPHLHPYPPSAGIGRTGVLVTMETAMCLIERNLPVYPLDVVRKMRDQRAMMVQTSSQYKFVCEAILRVYEEGLVPMLDPS